MLVPSITRKEPESSREMVSLPMVVTCPGLSSVAIWLMLMVVPPMTAGGATGAGVIGGRPIVLVPPTTTNPAELSNEIGTSFIVVCWPGLKTLVLSPMTITDLDGSIAMGPAPGSVTIGVGAMPLGTLVTGEPGVSVMTSFLVAVGLAGPACGGASI